MRKESQKVAKLMPLQAPLAKTAEDDNNESESAQQAKKATLAAPQNWLDVVVILDDASTADSSKIAQALAQTGLKIGNISPLTGTISGRCPSSAVGLVRKHAGVVSVEIDQVMETR